MSRNFIRQENLDADSVVDEPKGKVRFLSVITGEGDPSEPPPVPEKAWVYFDVTDDEAAVPFVWDPDSETWIPGAAGAIGGGSQPLILDVPGDDSVTTVPGPEVAMEVICRLLPSEAGGMNQHIVLPSPTGSGQRVTGLVGVNMDELAYSVYPGETVTYLDLEVLSPAVVATADFSFVFGLSTPIAINTTFDVTMQGVGMGSPTVVHVTLSDTYADAMELGADFLGQLAAAMDAHGFNFGEFDGGLGFYSLTAGEASVTISNVVGVDAFATGLGTVVSVPGEDEVLGEDLVEYGVLRLRDGTLGSTVPGGGTHTAPGDLNPHYKGWTVRDVAPGVWSVEDWPDRLNLHDGTWEEKFLGPIGEPDEKSLDQMLRGLRAFLIPEPSQRTIIRESRSQVTSGLGKDRFLLFSTGYTGEDIVYSLDPADGPQVDLSEPNPDFGCRSFELDFYREGGDNPAASVTVTDGGDFVYALAPGEHLVIRSQVVDYVDAELAAGTGVGQLDHSTNQVYGWRALIPAVEAIGGWKENILRSEASEPDVTVGAAAGTGGAASLFPGANDATGILTITTGTDTAAGILATVGFGAPFDALAITQVGATNANAAGVPVFVLPDGLPTGGFILRTTEALTAETSYEWSYQVIGVPD